MNNSSMTLLAAAVMVLFASLAFASNKMSNYNSGKVAKNCAAKCDNKAEKTEMAKESDK